MIGQRMIAALCTISFCLFAAGDPFSGVWKLNLSQSKLPPPTPQSQTVRIEADAGSIRIREEIVSEKGERVTVTLEAKFDGKDYAVAGSSFADTVAYQRVDSHTLKGTVKKGGKVVETETAVVSKNGKTMTATYSATEPTGKQFTGVAVLDKQ
jgi:hypothetical protein